MKKVSFFFILSLTCFSLSAQVPKGFSYQAIATDRAGSIVPNKPIAVKIFLLDGYVDGDVLYSEVHLVTTNKNGLFNLIIGEGSSLSGNFTDIDWSLNSRFIKIEIDTEGNGNFVTIGTNKLMSVPYALYAEKAGGLTNPSSEKISSAVPSPYGSSGCLAWNNNSLIRYTTKTYTNGNVVFGLDRIAVSNNSSTYTAYGHYSGGWVIQLMYGTLVPNLSTEGWVVTSTNVYVFDINLGVWYSSSFSGTPMKRMQYQQSVLSKNALVTTLGICYYDQSTHLFTWEPF